MKIHNGTAHPVNIIVNAVSDPAIRKYVVPEGVEVWISMSIPTSGMLNAKIQTVESTPINGIPVFDKQITACDAIPDADVVIVSALFVSAARAMGMDTSKLYTVADPVYTHDGKTILGSRGICPAF